MLTDTELDEYRTAIRQEVCSLCPERPAGGPPCAPLGKECGVEMHLPELIESIRHVHSPLIAPYLARNREQVCAGCALLRSHVCPCPMEYLVVPLVEAVEAVDERRRAAPADPPPPEPPAGRRDRPAGTVTVTLTILEGSLEGRSRKLVGPQKCVIGRADDCTIRLAGGLEFCTVSRHHCAVEVGAAGVRIRDLGSYNGTWVNGVRIGRPRNWHQGATAAAPFLYEVELHDGDEFRVGEITFGVAITGDGDAPPDEEEDVACAGCAHGLAVQCFPLDC
jgi:pSer/pThr/pTyr-binding forkhead associated (FHA) protein